MPAEVFQKILDALGCNPNKMWFDKVSEFCDKSLKSWLRGNSIEI